MPADPECLGDCLQGAKLVEILQSGRFRSVIMSFGYYIFLFLVVIFVASLSIQIKDLKKGTVRKFLLSSLKKIVYKTGSDKKCEFLGYSLGYLTGKNSSLNNHFIYKYVWDLAYRQEFNPVQIESFFKFFNKGKQMQEEDIAALVHSHRGVWDSRTVRMGLFNTLVGILFFDNVLTMREKNTFFKFARWMKISSTDAEKLLKVFLKKYNFVYREETETYISTYNFTGNVGSVANQYEKFFTETDDAPAMPREISNAYLFLDIDVNAAPADARRMYTDLAERYKHGSESSGKLDEEQRKLHREICEHIDRAWNIIREYRNW